MFTCTKSNQRQKGKGGSHLVVLMPLSVSYYSTQWFLSLGLMLIFDMILFTSSRTMNMGGDLLEKPTTEVEESGSYWPGNPALPPPPAPRNTYLNSRVRSLMSLSLSLSFSLSFFLSYYWKINPDLIDLKNTALPPPPAPRNTFLNSQVRSLMSLSLSNSIQPPTSSSLSSDQKKLSQQRRRSSSVPPTSESSGSWPSGIGER